jgi:hypothetical protein
MVSSGVVRRILAIVGGVSWMLVMSASGALASTSDPCDVDVSPKAAAAGSVNLAAAVAATRTAVIGFFAAIVIFGLTGGVLLGRQIQARARIR